MSGLNIYAIHLREVSLNGLPYWLTGILIYFSAIKGITEIKELKQEMYIKASIIS